jgi:hypothetical protein
MQLIGGTIRWIRLVDPVSFIVQGFYWEVKQAYLPMYSYLISMYVTGTAHTVIFTLLCIKLLHMCSITNNARSIVTNSLNCGSSVIILKFCEALNANQYASDFAVCSL